MEIEVTRLSKDELDHRSVFDWPIWEKEVSRFDWYYDEAEECFMLEGRATVQTSDGRRVEFGKGDFVRFPQGLACVWDIKEPVRKHYNFV